MDGASSADVPGKEEPGRRRGDAARRSAWWRRCPFCRSSDTDRPYVRRSRVLLLSWLIPPLRRRYCRNCHRHYYTLVPRGAAGRRDD